QRFTDQADRDSRLASSLRRRLVTPQALASANGQATRCPGTVIEDNPGPAPAAVDLTPQLLFNVSFRGRVGGDEPPICLTGVRLGVELEQKMLDVLPQVLLGDLARAAGQVPLKPAPDQIDRRCRTPLVVRPFALGV